MTKLLVTASQGYYQYKGLYLVDTETRTYEKVFGIPDPNASYNHQYCYLGLAQFKDGYILNTRKDGVVFFDKDFRVMETRFNAGRDLHDVIVVGTNYYVVETGDDSVATFEIETGKLIDRKFFGIEPKTPDQLHMNSIRFHNGKFYVSAFWTKDNTINKPTGQGVIMRLNNRLEFEDYVVTGLHKSHSILFVNDELHYIESETRSFCKYPHQILTKLESFPRGLTFDGEFFYIGESFNRASIKKEELPLQNGHANIIVFDPVTNTKKKIELPCTDIYDILVVNE